MIDVLFLVLDCPKFPMLDDRRRVEMLKGGQQMLEVSIFYKLQFRERNPAKTIYVSVKYFIDSLNHFKINVIDVVAVGNCSYLLSPI